MLVPLHSPSADIPTTATSAVDLDTDHAIQEIIRGPLFDDVTILTIAYVVFFLFQGTRR